VRSCARLIQATDAGHGDADLADAVNADDLEQSAIVLAVFAWHAAMRDEQIPRRGQR